ncbi:hypothetical protein BY996DRAFT_6548066 [Phakopsora pachyrhizi]|nr:hypothetical protein BY996DRAFT_6548066 [Phakopsora pachyrhizi]
MIQTIDPGTIRQILMRLEDTVILCKFFWPKTPTSPPTSTTTAVLQQTPIEQQQQQQEQQQQQQQQQQHSPLKSDTKNFRIQETSFQTETRMSMVSLIINIDSSGVLASKTLRMAFSSAVSMIENNPCKISGKIDGGGGLNISKGNS